MNMAMRTALLAVLVATDIGLSPDDIARNFDANPSIIENHLRDLQQKGYVKFENGLYQANGAANQAVELEALRSPTRS